MNKVLLMGRLTKDPDVRYTQGGEPLCIARFTLAVDSMRKDQQGNRLADFIQCVAMGKIGEVAEKYYTKGTKLCICGRWQTGSYQNQSGATVYTNECIIENAEFAESKNASGNAQNGPQGGYQNQGYSPNGYQPQSAPQGYQNPGFQTPPQQQGYQNGYQQYPNNGYQQNGFQQMPQQNAYNNPGEGFMHIPDNVDDEGLPFN